MRAVEVRSLVDRTPFLRQGWALLRRRALRLRVPGCGGPPQDARDQQREPAPTSTTAAPTHIAGTSPSMNVCGEA